MLVLAALVQMTVFLQVHGNTIGLTDAEIQIFRDNGVDVTERDSATWTISHHGIPDHGFPGDWGNNPNTPTVQNYSFAVPKHTDVVQVKGCVRLGPIGMSISGVPFYNPYSGQGHDAVEGDCTETFDDCSGHPGPSGSYHYHKLPACLYTGNRTEDLQNKFLGVAFDGYSIYGPMDETGKNWTSKELDRCHGHTHNGRYIYRITRDFPYILGCYHGSSVAQNASGNGPNMQGGGAGGRPSLPGGGTRPPPPDMSDMDTACGIQYADWQMKTCYAFCRSPSSGTYDDCPEDGGDPSAATAVTLSPFVALTLLCHLIAH